jgi:hypothetical protein
MTDTRRIVWLASYPKSGNTWTRIFLANYLVNRDQPVPINQAHRFAMGDAIGKTYAMVAGRPINTGDAGLTLQLRDRVLRGIVANGADVNFVKTHNLLGVVKGKPLIPNALTRSAVYIVRNPLDVVLSYARHFGMSKAAAASAMADPNNTIAATADTVEQYLGRWDDHVSAWTEDQPYPQLVLRYEDLLNAPEEHFAKLLQHIGIPVDPDRLSKAIRFSSFTELSKQENTTGFEEKSHHTKAFFAKGKSGQWKTDLDPEVVMQIQRDHRTVMEKFGYDT